MKNKILILVMCLFLLLPISVDAQRGCCSHHGGVSGGCSSSGKQICNDGTLSPTCTCTPSVSYKYGCTDKDAINYDSKANRDDGSCRYYVYGCMDEIAKNYNSNANKDDGSCEYFIYGCTDETANNYNVRAEKDDGSCKYNSNLSNKNNNIKEENSVNNDEVDPLGTITGLGMLGGIVYLIAKKKK